MPMRLREWIKRRGLTVRQFADEIGEQDSITRKWVYGQRQPSLTKALAIESYTSGEVTARELTVANHPEEAVASQAN